MPDLLLSFIFILLSLTLVLDTYKLRSQSQIAGLLHRYFVYDYFHEEATDFTQDFGIREYTCRKLIPWMSPYFLLLWVEVPYLFLLF